MIYWRVILTSVLSIAVMYAITRLLGYRQVSQLSMFDYVNGITIGSIAAELATAQENWLLPLIAMVVYCLGVLAFSALCGRFTAFRRNMEGKPEILYSDGELRFEAFRRTKLDLSEFLMMCRNGGYFDLQELQSVIMEPNGKLSFLPKGEYRPVCAQDMDISAKDSVLLANVILDGEIMEENLSAVGLTRTWLVNTLHERGIDKIRTVFLATADPSGTLCVYKKCVFREKDRLE
ncbi:MAG: DUF421 domain-containing protein [Ruminococcaceae bacterium]|nr:DUF421 domain-containing protein [Oscillospiraceae bacterium]